MDVGPPPPTMDLPALRLRPLRADDAADLFDYLSVPAVTELTGYPEITMSLVEAMIERSRSRWSAGEPAKWGIVRPHDDRVIGTVGFNEFSPAHRWAELAYDLAKPQWGRGLMRQAVAAVLEWTFQRDQVDRVHAYVRDDNLRSQRFLEHGGFVREGCLRSYRTCRGQARDFHIYSLLRTDGAAVLLSDGTRPQST